MITVENQLFSLHTRHTSYLFRVMETGHLEHLSYGNTQNVGGTGTSIYTKKKYGYRCEVYRYGKNDFKYLMEMK